MGSSDNRRFPIVAALNVDIYVVRLNFAILDIRVCVEMYVADIESPISSRRRPVTVATSSAKFSSFISISLQYRTVSDA